MHPDIKMGLAVGLALIGLVGAMFYRHEPDHLDEVPPPLTDQAAIDREIAQSPRTPYLNPIDDLDKGETGKPGTGSASSTAPTASQPGTTGPLADPADDLDAGDRATTVVTNRPAPAEPDPLRAPVRREEIPEHNREWVASAPRAGAGTSPAAGQATGGANAAAGPNKLRRHVVQPGDTLTRIAERYLGSKAYVRDIYQANRDRMRSIDDLPEGATLVIPDAATLSRSQTPAAAAPAGTASVPAREATPSRTRVEEEDSGEDPLRASSSTKPFKLTFEPVRRRRAPTSPGTTSERDQDRSAPEGRLGTIEDADEPLDLFESQDDSRLIDRRRRR